MKLTIISHTEHYQTPDGSIVGWGPTISEINYLASHFETITHVAMLHKGEVPPSALPYESSNIKFVALPVLGGKSVLSKLKMLFYIPKIISVVSKELKTTDVFQLRTPTGIGVFLIPFLTLFVKKKGWYKYAGNWNQENPPLGYRLQRWMLKKQSRIVTINGKWENQPKNIIAFENPCLTEKDIEIGKKLTESKTLLDKINYCFVGGLNTNKGIDRIVDAFKEIDTPKIGTLHVVGDGVLRKTIKEKAKGLSINCILHGSLPKEQVVEIYKQSHFIILPSQSEGFPKVIGEAMNYGCVPIVSDVSCIGQYVIEGINGYLINPITTDEIKKSIEKSVNISDKSFEMYLKGNYKRATIFTYDYYLKQIQNKIIQNH